MASSGIFNLGVVSSRYTLSNIMSIVSSTGTLVKRFSTSIEAMVPVLGVFLSRSRNSNDDLTQCFIGTYGTRIWLMVLTNE